MVDIIENLTYAELVKVLRDDSITVGLAGPPGVGKTSLLFAIGKALKKPYIGKVQFHSELSPGEIMGIPLPGAKDLWIPGPGDLAYKQGGMLILDEIDKASGPTKTYCYSLLDRGPGGTVSYIGRTFTQANGYQPVATMNEDPRDGSLPEALLDRFDAWFFVLRPHDRLLNLLDADLREQCVKCYDAAADPMVGPEFSFRMFLGYQKLRKKLPMEKALLGATYGNQLLARSMYEALVLSDDGEYDEDEEEDEDEEDDEYEDEDEDEEPEDDEENDEE